MKVKEQYDVGVIVARFQVDELHEAHRALIQSVIDQHRKVLLFLGLSPVKGTKYNPLDYEARRQMVNEVFPSLNVGYIKNMPSDENWSRRLDELIEDQLTPTQTAVLYGSRDSFLPQYSGRYPTRELEQDSWVSGTERRRLLASSSAGNSVEWRRGAIWATTNRFPTAFTTVDVALMSADGMKVLLAKKPGEPKHRFVGGFSTPGSESFEADAIREVTEETSLEISEPEYVTSMPIDDWRYREERDKIKTLLFKATVLFGRPTPGDDLKGGTLDWFELSSFPESEMLPTHRPLLRALRRNVLGCPECGLVGDHKLQCSRAATISRCPASEQRTRRT